MCLEMGVIRSRKACSSQGPYAAHHFETTIALVCINKIFTKKIETHPLGIPLYLIFFGNWYPSTLGFSKGRAVRYLELWKYHRTGLAF